MSSRVLQSGALLLALCVAAHVLDVGRAEAAGAGPALPGRIIDDFTLNDAHGAKRSLSEWSDRQAVVVVFLGTECPLAKLYGTRLADLDRQYRRRGVQIVGINSNQQDTLQELIGYGTRHDIEFPLLKDAGALVADQFGATRTPEAFVLDRGRVVRYHGRIDDQYGVGAARNAPTRSELVEAIEAVLAGKPVPTATTNPVGCLIGRRRQPQSPSSADVPVTFAKDIAPILHKHCVSCHRPGQIAPFALTEYADVAAWSDTMLEVIDAGRMPPWHANPAHGEFYNDARMPDAAKATFRKWVAAGAPEGNPADAPPLPKFSDAWQVPEPRTVFKMPEPFQVPATGTVPYQYFTIDPKFTEDKWVRAAEARPGNREVVHHLIMFYLPPEYEKFRPQDPLFNAVAAFAPGMPAIAGPEEFAVRIPAGSKLIFQVHYTPNGRATTDQSEAAVVFSDPAKVQKQVRITAGFNFKFMIPPGAADYTVTKQLPIRRDTLVYTITPHMHYRGKSFKFTARYPDGGSEVLLDVPRYDFNWQNTYLLKTPKRLPAGTVIDMEAHYDNSANNPLNPDPSQFVYWGDQTWEEMMLGSLTTSHADEDLRTARKPAP
ncbi:MAG TPA: redoxin domain-containing protein [Lacipirellulaceae bacterium]|nr:redoxin domain-containing protein [Lacipirellulaceae bacterium]